MLRLSIMRYLTGCFARQTPPRLYELCVDLQMSRSTLWRLFRCRYNESPASYMKAVQIHHAQQLLRETDLSATEVGYRCGFGTRRTFFRAFRRVTSMTPSEWRRERTKTDPANRRRRIPR